MNVPDSVLVILMAVGLGIILWAFISVRVSNWKAGQSRHRRRQRNWREQPPQTGQALIDNTKS